MPRSLRTIGQLAGLALASATSRVDRRSVRNARESLDDRERGAGDHGRG